MMAILGDIHFNSAKPYFTRVAEEFLRWFSEWEYNTPDNTLILVGDLVHTAINGGLVVSWLETFVNASRFQHIHVVRGNHDYKKKDGVEQLAYEFYRERSNVTIYESRTEIQIEGQRVLLLPYYHYGLNQETMAQSYSVIHKENQTYDLVVGHFADESFGLGSDIVKNVGKIESKHICLGHIHTRVNPEIYIGSVYANKVNENDNRRAAWIIDSNSRKVEVPLPKFCEFVSVNFPEPLPVSDAIVPIYTILNCASEQAALAHYGSDIYLRKVVRDMNRVASVNGINIASGLEGLSIEQMFQAFLKAKADVNRSVAGKCLSLIRSS